MEDERRWRMRGDEGWDETKDEQARKPMICKTRK
jgi:hypothetical protein